MPATQPARHSLMAHWYYWVAGYFLLGAMEAFGFVDRMMYGSWEGKGGDTITQTFNLLLILSSVTMFYYGYRKRRRIGRGGILALCAVVYLLLTAFWSTVPEMTIRQAIVYGFVVIGSIGVANSLESDEFIDLLGWACFLTAIGSLLLLVVSHGSAFGGYDHTDFQGIFSQKNVLGQVMLTGTLASLHAIRSGRRRGLMRNLFFLGVFWIVALASKSATSWLAMLVVCLADRIFVYYRQGGAARTLAVTAAVTLVPLLLTVAADPDTILEMIGKDPTLTGRTDIWDFVISDIWQKPLFGWGYFGFWNGLNPAAVEISDAIHWVVPQAHNGLLEMLVNIGFVGTGIYLFMMVRNTIMAVRCLRSPAHALGVTALLCYISILIIGISEAVLLASIQSSTSMFFITGLMCERALRTARQRRRQPAPGAYPQRFPRVPAPRFSRAGRT